MKRRRGKSKRRKRRGRKEKERKKTKTRNRTIGEKQIRRKMRQCTKQSTSNPAASCVCVFGKEQNQPYRQAQVPHKHADPQLCVSDFTCAFLRDHSLTSHLRMAFDRLM